MFKRTGKHYAIKEMSKVKIIDKKSIENIQMERDILSSLHSPYVFLYLYHCYYFDLGLLLT
jgi:serine/threonine protein kinase